MEHANGDIKGMLVAWMSENNTQDWSVGLRFVPNMKNSAYHSGIKHTPYKAMFGSDPKVGLISSLPSEVLARIQREDDLLALFPAHTLQPTPAHSSAYTSTCTHLSAYATTCSSCLHPSAYATTTPEGCKQETIL